MKGGVRISGAGAGARDNASEATVPKVRVSSSARAKQCAGHAADARNRAAGKGRDEARAMSAAVPNRAAPIARPTRSSAPTARAEARAYLWAEGDISDLHEAVDKLQADAVRDGSSTAIGQDGAGHDGQGVRRGAQAVRRRRARRRRARPVPTAPDKRAADSTVDALFYSLRQRNSAALAERHPVSTASPSCPPRRSATSSAG